MKVIKIFPLLLIFLGLIPSCRCPDVDPFYMPKGLETTAIWNSSLYEDFENLVIEEAVGFELWTDFIDKQYFSQSQPSFSLISTLMATQPCPDDGHEGLKHKLNSLLITSSSDFQDVAAGESINDFFHILDYAQPSEEEESGFIGVAIENAVASINEPYAHVSGVQFRLSELPGNNLEHIFRVTLTFDDGSVITDVSSEVQF